MVYGRGWSHWPTLHFLSGWYTSHTSLIIILYPARDPATFCCFSQLRSYFRPTASSSWRGNALGFLKPQHSRLIMTSQWQFDNCCYATMWGQGQAFCFLTLEFNSHLRYCSSQEVDVSLSHSAVLRYTIIFKIEVGNHLWNMFLHLRSDV